MMRPLDAPRSTPRKLAPVCMGSLNELEDLLRKGVNKLIDVFLRRHSSESFMHAGSGAGVIAVWIEIVRVTRVREAQPPLHRKQINNFFGWDLLERGVKLARNHDCLAVGFNYLDEPFSMRDGIGPAYDAMVLQKNCVVVLHHRRHGSGKFDRSGRLVGS